MGHKSLDLEGKVAVVVGATSGLGRSIAIGLAEAGADVVPTGRRADRLDEVSAAIESAGRKTLRKTTDVSDRASIDALRNEVVGAFGRVDILVNSAGKMLKKASHEIEDEEWRDILDTNLTGILRSCQSFFEPLKESDHGRVVNIASLTSFVALYQVAGYSASKAAVLSLTQSLAVEWAPHEICVNAIAPGVFPTELNEELLNKTDRGKELRLRTPMQRFGRSEELVGAAVLLASDAASFITGQCIAVDGGFLASGVNC
ncbi:MAG: glucose 1-dehydrogenase [Planctomycetes bacterium]|nr:glucose 1-dehydrogenase [Planctomycetota bacterium]